MMIERTETWNLWEGLGRIRWGDDFTTIRRVYPAAYEKLRRFGRNLSTGEVMEAPPGLVIPRFLAGPDELSMEASVEFRETDEKFVVETLAIGPEFPEGENDFDARRRVSEGTIRFLSQKLGLQPLELDLTWDLMEQRWETGGASVLLFRENADDFTLFVEPPMS